MAYRGSWAGVSGLGGCPAMGENGPRRGVTGRAGRIVARTGKTPPRPFVHLVTFGYNSKRKKAPEGAWLGLCRPEVVIKGGYPNVPRPVILIRWGLGLNGEPFKANHFSTIDSVIPLFSD